MKKDSFTFSDKLKKSKSLPLSKRIPSRSGGEVKAKRTLFERAQRDLPFIIVAALALLLLPFLSREAVEIETPSVVWGDGDSYIDEFNQPKSAEGEIALSSFRNPLDLIIRHGDKDSSARDSVDTYGSGSEDSSASEYSGSSSYSSDEYSSSAPATANYGKTVRRSVRNSINRVPTSIGSLRTGSMASPGAGSGVGHSMAFGSRAKDAAAKVQGPGVRPVALQPLTASGKGRDLTGGDALYAEAARSIGAMNKPGAKRALLDAQLADVDGKPLGDTKAAAAAAPNKPGAGGTPSNNWSHRNQKPWWWDMMSDRAQKRWMLWHYNWEKMASDSLIKLTSGLASCLITGSNNFEVGKFLGSPGGGSDYECFDSSGKIIEAVGARSNYVEGIATTTKTKDGGSETHVSPEIAIEYQRYCASFGGRVQMTQSSRKSALDVRLRCLGMKLSELKNKTQVKYKNICDGVTGDPMSINITATRNGKDKPNKLKNMGFFVVSNETCPDYTGHKDVADNYNVKAFQVTYIKAADYGKNIIPDNAAKNAKKVVVYKVGNTGIGFFPEGNTDPTFERDDLDKYKNKKGEYNSEEEIYWESEDYYRGLREAEQKIQDAINAGECLSEAKVREILKPNGKWKAKNSANRVNEIAICDVPQRFTGTTYRPVNMSETEGQWNDDVPLFDCGGHNEVFINKALGMHKFSTTITNPGPRTLAFVLEKVQQGPNAPGYFKDGNNATVADRTGYLIKKKIDYAPGKGYEHLVFKDNPAKGQTTFYGDVQVGISDSVQDDKFDLKNARPGDGWIVWITTDNMNLEGAKEGSVVYDLSASTLFNHKNKKSATCKYRWGCDAAASCEEVFGGDSKICYVIENGEKKFYNYVRTPKGYFLRKQGSALSNVEENGTIYPCQDICELKKEPLTYGVKTSGGQIIEEIPADKLNPEVYIENPCPVCNKDLCKGPDGKGYPCKVVGDKYIPTQSTPETDTCEGCPDCSGGICYIDNLVYPSVSFRSDDGKIYHIRTSARGIPGKAEYPCTTICAKEDVGIFETALDTPTVPLNGTALTTDTGKINPVQAGDKDLCPFCNPDNNAPKEEGEYSGLTSRAVNFVNGCYDTFYKVSSYDWDEYKTEVVDKAVMRGITDFVIEGHASSRNKYSCPNCNDMLAYDRAVRLYNEMFEVLKDDYNIELKNQGNGIAGEYPVNKDCTTCNESCWPKSRNILTDDSSDLSKPTITITLKSFGDTKSNEPRPSFGESKADRGSALQREEDDRNAIIYPVIPQGK